MRTCHRHYPGRFNGACSLVCLHCQRPSPCNSKVGSYNYFFGACSAFTHVTPCTLAESPSDPLHRKLRQLCCLGCRFDCYRVERTSSRAGCTRWSPAPFTAHCYANNDAEKLLGIATVFYRRVFWVLSQVTVASSSGEVNSC